MQWPSWMRKGYNPPAATALGMSPPKEEEQRRGQIVNPYIPLPGHPLVRVEVQSVCQDVVRVWYIGDRDHLLAAGVADEEMLTEWPRKRGKVSCPQRMERTYIDRYWHNSGAGRVQRFRVLMVRTLENAQFLPGFRDALAAYRNRIHGREVSGRITVTSPGSRRQKPASKRPSYLRLVVDNTRHPQ
jgi:hypothetical protein